MKHQARKRFGQNFLQDPGIIHAILEAIHPLAEDNLMEIGPGLAALTEPLLTRVNHLKAVEIDRDLIGYLQTLPQAKEKLELIQADALKLDYSQYGQRLRLVGNLPYNISTPLLLHLLQYGSHIEDMHFMLQKEVVERLAASPGCKDYGRLTIMIQYHCQVEHLFNVPPEAFDPKPKVESAIVRLCPHPQPIYEPIAIKNLETLVATAFAMRRKTLANNLKKYISSNQLEELNINPQQRPEQISIKDYLKIAKFIFK